jgi:hypothetical protein
MCLLKRKRTVSKGNISITDQPLVKYRSILSMMKHLLSGWSKKNSADSIICSMKLFELILRLKGNYLWPAMWGNAFYDDDMLNKKSAEDFSIVIGTSHHEPLLRAHDEWRRYGQGKWDYDSNETRLRSSWKEGMQRAKGSETILLVAREGDKPMSDGTAIY